MEVKFFYGKLKGRIEDKFGSQKTFAKVIGLSETSLSKKLNSKNCFTNQEIVKWCNLLEISLSDVDSYFFTI